MIGRLDHLFKDAKYVRNAQIEQDSRNSVIIRIERDEGYTSGVEKTIRKEAVSRLGDKMELNFEYVNEIEKQPNGKFKFVLQKMKFMQGLKQ